VQYWPDDGKRMFQDIEVTLLKEDVFSDYTIRDLSITKVIRQREIRQY